MLVNFLLVSWVLLTNPLISTPISILLSQITKPYDSLNVYSFMLIKFYANRTESLKNYTLIIYWFDASVEIILSVYFWTATYFQHLFNTFFSYIYIYIFLLHYSFIIFISLFVSNSILDAQIFWYCIHKSHTSLDVHINPVNIKYKYVLYNKIKIKYVHKYRQKISPNTVCTYLARCFWNSHKHAYRHYDIMDLFRLLNLFSGVL